MHTFCGVANALQTAQNLHTKRTTEAPSYVNLSSNPFAFAHGLDGVDQQGNFLWVNVLLICFGILCAITLATRVSRQGLGFLRRISSMGTASTQVYWSYNQNTWIPWIKRHILYAPFWKTKHNDEIRISKAVAIGTLPSRFHMILLVLYGASNVAYCLALPYGRAESASVVAALRGRTGSLAALNLIPTVLFALRNNPLIPLLHVSYDTFNLFHRWAARIVIVEAFVHIVAWATNSFKADHWAGVLKELNGTPSYQWGAVGGAFFFAIFFQAWSPIRHAFYETFVNLHRLFVLLAIVGVCVHLDLHSLPQLPWVKVALAFWILEWLFRTLRIVYYNLSPRAITRVTIEAMPAEACRVTFDLVRPWKHRPGTHVHVYLPTISLWSSHPFSVAWSSNTPSTPSLADEKLELPTTSTDPDTSFSRPNSTATTISLICRARSGTTRHMHDLARAAPDGRLVTYGLIEGPYGGHESLDSYGTVVLFAAGVGITHQTSFVRHLVAGHSSGTTATRKITLCWSIPSTECLEWVRPWMDEVLRMPGRRDCLRILLFITRPRNHAEINSNSGSVQMFPGRCDVQAVIDREIEERVGAMAVSVCGAGAFSDGVRRAARKRVGWGNVDFVEEAFTY
ncbi:putative FRE ferric reductase-like transmembrane component [Saccharata proteae CBS 121410]|uniref:FRE ferric reductase-like transmembrane component n=1 Tax=Saccharata proteae CBS 121410 TaxID=1314787 RepID=A0A9P4HQ57_9PEZI|nr:putative FRE ferric reductase-like transmembrane component [Saccharata proteae CBS 121410]